MEQPNKLPLLKFTEEQTTLLQTLYHDLTARLADWTFNDPERDEFFLRQHAAMSGKRQQIHDLLTHDAEVLAQAQEAQEAKASQNFSQQPE